MVDIVNSFTIKKDKRESEKEANENELLDLVTAKESVKTKISTIRYS